jgi:signal transduction histidine kinase
MQDEKVMNVKTVFSLLDVPTTDPDDARRRRLLNIILVGFMIIVLVVVIIVGISILTGILSVSDFGKVFWSALGFLIGNIIILAINRYWSGLIASSLFLFFLTMLFSFTDTPKEVAAGRSLFYFAIPIIMSSVLLRSYASFFIAVLTSFTIAGVGLSVNISPDPIPMFGFFAVGLISWLSARSLEQALTDLRITNAELDQRVADRTQELSQSLAREHAEGSRRQAILEGIGDGVIVLNNDNDIIMANPAISRLLEIPVEQIANHKFDDILQSPVLSGEDRNALIQVINSTDTAMAPMRIRWDKKTLSVNSAPVMDANGGTIGNVAVLRDFTREAEVEEMKNTFVAMVSHELRTPLNAILGYSEMMRDAVYGPVNKKQANAADRILKNSRRLFDIVNDLLDKAQIEAGHLALHYEEFKTVELVENLHSVMDKIANDKGLELNAVVAPEMPDMIKGDPQRLQQVMINLANNAVKFTDKGGIYIRIYRVTDEHWAFDVTDTGPGIALEDQKYIFDPFRQVDGTITRSHGGIGLGLAIVKRIVDLMGGRIFVQSSLGHGTMFTVVLPLAPVEKEE